jgi:hypothetical protein
LSSTAAATPEALPSPLRESARDGLDGTVMLQAERDQDSAISRRHVAGIAALVIRDEGFADDALVIARDRHGVAHAGMFKIEGLGRAPIRQPRAHHGRPSCFECGNGVRQLLAEDRLACCAQRAAQGAQGRRPWRHATTALS